MEVVLELEVELLAISCRSVVIGVPSGSKCSRSCDEVVVVVGSA